MNVSFGDRKLLGFSCFAPVLVKCSSPSLHQSLRFAAAVLEKNLWFLKL